MHALSWSDLLPALSVPRENGTAGLATAKAFIIEQLDGAGVAWRVQEISARPLEPVALGVVVGLLCCAYWWALRSSRQYVGLFLALLLAAVPIAQLDWQVPLTPGHTASESNIFGVVSAPHPSQRLILAAHYDTKTELTDHIVRIPVEILGAVLIVLAVLLTPFCGLAKFRRLSRVLGVGVLGYGILFMLLFSAGALRQERSSGALDDGAACMVLLKAASLLSADNSLVKTEVVFAFFTGEELGAEGSWAFAKERFAVEPRMKTYMINFDPIGASSDLTVVHREGGLLRSFIPNESVVSLIDAAHRKVAGRPIGHTSGGGLTDAFPLLAYGVPAATIISAVPPFVVPRGMHTPNDIVSRVDLSSMDRTLGFVMEVVHLFDHGSR